MHFMSHWLGLDNAAGPLYLWWSGFFGDLAIFGAVGIFYWKHSCHQRHCLRIGKHHIDGTPYCSKHKSTSKS